METCLQHLENPCLSSFSLMVDTYLSMYRGVWSGNQRKISDVMPNTGIQSFSYIDVYYDHLPIKLLMVPFQDIFSLSNTV